mgnify:CR=1 FL=1
MPANEKLTAFVAKCEDPAQLRTMIANAKAPKTDKAYALFRAINCYAPAGYNSCGGEDVASAVRKAWFRQLKSGFADTQWGKSLQYYW